MPLLGSRQADRGSTGGVHGGGDGVAPLENSDDSDEVYDGPGNEPLVENEVKDLSTNDADDVLDQDEPLDTQLTLEVAGGGGSTDLKSREDDRMVTKTTSGGKATLVLFLFGKLLANPFTNVVRQKSQTAALDYGIFLSQLYTIISTILFSLACAWQVRKGIVTKEQWKVPKWLFAGLGFMDSATRVVDFVSQPLFGAKGGAMVLLLNQTLIPITMALAFVLTGKRYTIPNLLGAGIILSGVCIFVLPKQLRGQGGGTFSVVGLILRLLKNIAFALTQIYQGKLMAKFKLDTLYLGWWVKVFGLPLGVIMSYIYFAIADGESAFFHQMREGFHCLGGSGVGVVPTCKDGLLLWTLLFNVGAFIDVYTALGILKHGNPTMLVVIMTMCLPLTSLLFSSKSIMGDSANPLNAGDIYGLVVVVVGVLIYGLLGPAKDSIVFSAFISFVSVCVFASFFVHGDEFSLDFEVGPEFGDLAIFYGFLALLLLGLYFNGASPASTLFILRRRLGKWVGWPILTFPTVGELALVLSYVGLLVGWGAYWYSYDRGIISRHVSSARYGGGGSGPAYNYSYNYNISGWDHGVGPVLSLYSGDNHPVTSATYDYSYSGYGGSYSDYGPPQMKLESVARAVGHINEVNFALQLLPITRNSVWAAVFGIPFDRLVRYHRWTGTALLASMTLHASLWGAVLMRNGKSGMCAVKSTVPAVRGVPDCSQVSCIPCEWKGDAWQPKSLYWNGTYIYSSQITAPVTYWENLASYSGFFAKQRENWTIPLAQSAWGMTLIYLILYKISRLKALQPSRQAVNTSKVIQFLQRNMFEIFYYVHWSAMVTFIFALIHNVHSSSNTMMRYVVLAVPLYLFDVGVRTWKSWKKAECVGLTLYEDQTIVRIEMKKPSLTFEPGQYLFLKAHAVSSMQWHPFSISCTPGRETFTVHIRDNGEGSWTRGVIQEASKHLERPEGMELTPDGSYGKTSLSYAGYSDIILVAGGIGVTSVISVFEDLYETLSAMDPEDRSHVNQKVWLYWVVSSESTLELFADLLLKVDKDIESKSLPMTLCLHVTHSQTRRAQSSLMTSEADIEMQDIALTDSHVAGRDWSPETIRSGRPGWAGEFERISSSPTQAKRKQCGVFVCGPTSMSRELAEVCRVFTASDNDVRFDFHKERYRF